MKFKKRPKKHAKIEVVPLIDVVFFLLATFVMVSLSMTKNEGITVNNPAASTASPKDNKEETLTLSLAQTGEIFFNKEKINVAQLPLRLQNFKSANKEGQVVVNGDGEVPYKFIVTVLDEARKAGFTKIAHSVERK
ncbi:outer membrane transport energization protein ExbD [Prosthecobacter fusiformis]|uniref:Outer membrane transport energization protein ExbD n=1 Tax=Prosthecobacter fusiformis TaxID=48464 RepID=A0A4R7S3K2_9BACT|nr:biopolymer transporter ExbD [Prosthecobacter fusiformis]TDU72901.1 outer membrane transport energization protein ExbD [Prosthecobacter fusiformis]